MYTQADNLLERSTDFVFGKLHGRDHVSMACFSHTETPEITIKDARKRSNAQLTKNVFPQNPLSV